MLGYVTCQGIGAADALLAGVARQLAADGVALAGVVQENTEAAPGDRCHMDLVALSGTGRIRISQSLGPLARGCRLDADGLERAVALVEAALTATGPDAPRLLIVNKFGKQEDEGRGFRAVIGEALAAGIPVLTAVSETYRDRFLGFVDGMGEELQPDRAKVYAWAQRAISGERET